MIHSQVERIKPFVLLPIFVIFTITYRKNEVHELINIGLGSSINDTCLSVYLICIVFNKIGMYKIFFFR